MTEEWRRIPGHQGLYEVSSLGRVRSWNNNRWGRLESPRMMKGHSHPMGYWRVQLGGDGPKRIPYLVHRLVAQAFMGDCPPGMQVCHNDGNKLNNVADNLRYDTPAGNSADRIEHGTSRRGEDSPRAKLTVAQVHRIRRMGKTMGRKRIAEAIGITEWAVRDILSGRNWGWLE
jgi:hypothetical protein